MSFIRRQFNRVLYVLPRILLVSIFIVYVVFAFLTYFDYFEPYLYPLSFIRGDASSVTKDIIIGPYPHYEELKVLKEKYRTDFVVSLLNLNLPQEKALYQREARDCERLGLEALSFPMEYLPLQSEENKKARGKLLDFLLKNAGKKVYIHCYLGKHRVSFVKQGLRDAGIIAEEKGVAN